MFTLSIQINMYPRDHSHPWTGSQKHCHRQMCWHTYTFTHSLTHKTLLTLKHSQTCPPVHSHSHTHTLTCAYWHSLLHTNMLKHSLNHMTMPIDSFTQGHKCLYSKVPTHTFHLYMHIFTQNLCSHRYSHTNMFTSSMKLRYSLKEENTLTSTSTHVYVWLTQIHSPVN